MPHNLSVCGVIEHWRTGATGLGKTVSSAFSTHSLTLVCSLCFGRTIQYLMKPSWINSMCGFVMSRESTGVAKIEVRLGLFVSYDRQEDFMRLRLAGLAISLRRSMSRRVTSNTTSTDICLLHREKFWDNSHCFCTVYLVYSCARLAKLVHVTQGYIHAGSTPVVLFVA
ncbi:hypothetical protein K440DRAFT_156273 [Wilcoxina mikolae CBS 423.85]|nr:hypothetical protein K440DRAFT_156273 [Wilcoxina mikolae CBS 423.85]